MIVRNDDFRLGPSEIWTPCGSGRVTAHAPEYDEHISTAFNQMSGCAALSAGRVPDPENFSRNTGTEDYIDINRLVIKFPYQDEYRIPKFLAPMYGKTLRAIFEDQYARNAEAACAKSALLYVTRTYLQKGQYQRIPDWHRDETRSVSRSVNPLIPLSTKIPPHIYTVSDSTPTQVQSRPVHNGDELFGDDASDKEKPVRENAVRLLKPYEIGLMNSYVWHRGTRAAQDGVRTFLSVMFLPHKPMENAIRQGAYQEKGYKPEL